VTRLSLVALVGLVVGCASNGIPAATPAGMDDLVAALVVRGASITDQVAGDAGCADRTLIGNAVRLDVRMSDEDAVSPVYVFRWRRVADFDAAAAPFADCVAEFGQRTGAEHMDQVSHTLWRAYGPNWPARLRDAVNAALLQAGGA
jgi:hypothetical protein